MAKNRHKSQLRWLMLQGMESWVLKVSLVSIVTEAIFHIYVYQTSELQAPMRLRTAVLLQD